MELQASRTPARTAADGAPILLLEQVRRHWDGVLIARGLQALARAEALGLGRYGLQAAIAACHAGRALPRTPTGSGSPLRMRRSRGSRLHP
jgi:predicted RNA polymerase sigma factor